MPSGSRARLGDPPRGEDAASHRNGHVEQRQAQAALLHQAQRVPSKRGKRAEPATDPHREEEPHGRGFAPGVGPATEVQARSPVAKTLAARTAHGNAVSEGDRMDDSPWPTAKRRTLPSPPPRNTAIQVVSVGVMGWGRGGGFDGRTSAQPPPVPSPQSIRTGRRRGNARRGECGSNQSTQPKAPSRGTTSPPAAIP